MLVLTRKEGEQIRIGNDIVITVVRTGGDKIRLGIDAPVDMVVLRSELKKREREEIGFPHGLTDDCLALPFPSMDKVSCS